MKLIPFPVSDEEYSVFVILEPENIKRMADNDPAQINIWKLPEPFSKMRLRDVILSSPSLQDAATAEGMIAKGRGAAAMEFLSRGFQFKPKEGDNDLPYQHKRSH